MLPPLTCSLHRAQQQRPPQPYPAIGRVDCQQSNVADPLDVVPICHLVHGAEASAGKATVWCNSNEIQLGLIAGREVVVHAHAVPENSLV
jgi:hypothetical protein